MSEHKVNNEHRTYRNTVFTIKIKNTNDLMLLNSLSDKINDGIIQVFQPSTNTLVNAKSLIGFLSLNFNSDEVLKLIIQANLTDEEYSELKQFKKKEGNYK